MRTKPVDELLPPTSLESEGDAVVARSLSSFANRTSRRSFIAMAGRAGLAVMGGAFLSLWGMESASAACGGSHGPTARLSCLCTDLLGTNNCPQCCSGFWTVCETSGPHACSKSCAGGGNKYFIARLYDCCNNCSGIGCNTNVAGCRGGNDTCCHGGYCGDGCFGQMVRCVRKVCTSNRCVNCP